MKDQSIASFSDRELLELILTNQIHMFREIRRIKEHVDTGKDTVRTQYWMTFKKMLAESEVIRQQADYYLQNKEEADENYDPGSMGEG
ncbi:MAG: hypothetical protein ABI863_09265 [Ginsengibacter sp.]